MATCALFIDYENVCKSLRGQNIPANHKQLAEIFKTEAEKHGKVVYARAYAPWDLYPEAMGIFDRQGVKPDYVEGGRKDNADLVMSLQIHEYLRVLGREAETFILVTGDGDFVHVMRLLQQEGKRVVIWGVEGSISNRLHRMGEIQNIQDLLRAYGVLPSLSVGAAESELPPNYECSIEAIRSLIVRSESIMLSRGWVQVPFLTLMHEMSTSSVFGADSEQRRLLIVRCLEEDMMETKKQPNPKRPGTETTFVLLKKENAVVNSTLQTLSRVIVHMRQLVAAGGGQAVPYMRLEESLAQDHQLPPAVIAERRSWIDLCISEKLIRIDRKDGGDLSSAVLYLAEEQPLVQQVVPGEDMTPMLRRLVLLMSHYLVRTGYAWMSMGLLRQQLGNYGQQEMERAIRQANETGIILIRQQPNQFGSRPTTGAYLQVEHPLVHETLSLRDELLHVMVGLFADRDAVAEQVMEEAMNQVHRDHALSVQDHVDLMLNQQVISRATTGDGELGYSLNRQHPVIVKRSALV